MSVNSIFGLPGILEVCLESRFSQGVFLAHKIKAKFKIEFKETSKTSKYVAATIATKEVKDDEPIPILQSSFFDAFTDSTASIIQAASIPFTEAPASLE